MLALGMTGTLVASAATSVMAGLAAYHFMEQYISLFIARKLCGVDQCKAEKRLVAEPIGVVAAAVYLIFMFAFIPVPFYAWSNEQSLLEQVADPPFAYLRLLSLLAGIISICTAILLGFADDMLDLRWRHKLLFPTLSSMPLLLVYFISKNSTSMLLPKMVMGWLSGGSSSPASYIDLGPLFYVYMAMLVIFCTNAINIIAGINGVEVGQSLVIATSVAIFNLVQVCRLDEVAAWHHALSLCILLPFIGTSLALFLLNKYPARVFVGDTYCYWAGMTIAVVAINGGFSKTLALFLVPQVLNFLYSVPQLFHWIPCPRHRLPKLNAETGRLEMSTTEVEPDRLSLLGRIALKTLITLRMVHSREFEKESRRCVEINNLTILNFLLKVMGPMHEWELTNCFLALQVTCSAGAFFCRFYLAQLLYDNVQ